MFMAGPEDSILAEIGIAHQIFLFTTDRTGMGHFFWELTLYLIVSTGGHKTLQGTVTSGIRS
jgi:hypothetical protein